MPWVPDSSRNSRLQCTYRQPRPDPYVRELETYFLTEAGFGVTFADDGLQALEIARQTLPTIVITEILVPKLDGLALCRRLKSDPATRDIAVLVFSLLAAERRAPKLPVLFISGYTDDEMVRRGLIEPNSPFIGKPFTPEALAAKVRLLLDETARDKQGNGRR